MNVPIWMARRIAASGKDSFSKMIIRIASLAVALSVTVMVVSLSLISGFKHQIREKIFGFWGHIHIMDTNSRLTYEPSPMDWRCKTYDDIKRTEPIIYNNNDDDNNALNRLFTGKNKYTKAVKHVQGFATKPGIIKTKDAIEGIILKGVGDDFDWSFMEQYWVRGQKINLKDTVVNRGIVISQQTSDRLKIDVGSKLVVYFVKNGEQLKRVFDVTGIYKTGLEEYDKKLAIIDIRILQQLLDWSPNQVAGYEIFLDDINDLEPLTAHIYENKIDDTMGAETIREKFPGIFEWLDLQDINGYIILGLMMVVGIISMITTTLILILERTNMIGIMKSLGENNKNIRSIFMYHGLIIAVKGLFCGNLVGITLCFLQERYKSIKLPEADYYLSYVPIELNWSGILLLNIVTILVIFLSLNLPLILVNRINPIKAIEYK